MTNIQKTNEPGTRLVIFTKGGTIPTNGNLESVWHPKPLKIGTLNSVRERFSSDLEAEEQVDGCYRNLTECLVRLASFYLTTLKAEECVEGNYPR